MELLRLLFSLVVLQVVQGPRPASALSPDGLSLLALKSAVDPASSFPSGEASPFSNWDPSDTDPCRWTGVTCANVSGRLRVVAVAVSGKDLQGYIPSELGSLAFLRRLNIHGNRLSGPIPAQLFNATSLHSLFLYGNNLSGPIPPAVCSLPRLQNLDLSRNSLSGHLPANFADCHQLQRLLLAGNRFSGMLPAGVWPKLASLVELDLSDNQLAGPIPLDLGELKSLSGTLNLSFNRFSGQIPKSLGKLPVTVSLNLRNNNLIGEIPQSGSFAYQGPTAFLGNPGLCGFPLQKPCTTTGSKSPAPKNPPRELHAGKRKRGLRPGMIVLISVADAAGVAAVGLVVVYIYWRRKDERSCSCTRKRQLGGEERACMCWRALGGGSGNSSEAEAEKWGEMGEEIVGDGGGGGGEGGELVAIDKGFRCELDELLRASAYVLGKSGLGIVYKVVLGSGVPVAVRRLGEGGAQRYREFAAEVQAIGRVRHQNMVRLRAYYWAPDEKLLISDFVSNGNLALALHGRSGQPSPSMPWLTRLRIARGVARGLAHLHDCSPRKYVHGDVKPTNILLDAEFNPYISDFGLNRLISITGNSSSDHPTGFIGAALPSTRSAVLERVHNYRAPEARLLGGRPTQKWDIYSFGLVLLEMLTGRSPELPPPGTPSPSSSEGMIELVKWVRQGFEEENPLSEMVDPSLLQEVNAKKEVLSVFHIALACTETDPELRPRMKTVYEHLGRMGGHYSFRIFLSKFPDDEFQIRARLFCFFLYFHFE